MHERPPVDPFRQLAEIDDPEERERTRREWGLVGLDEYGRRRPIRSYGSGLHSRINRGIAGDDWETYFGDDTESFAAFQKRQAAEERRRRCGNLYLTWQQVAELHDAASYLNQEFRLTLNSHLTITYRELGIEDHPSAAVVLYDFNREANKWFRDKKYKYHYLYVHENARERGFHTHLLMHFPAPWLRRDFRRWVAAFFRRRCGGPCPPPTAVDLQIRYDRDLAQRITRQWRWVRYLCKGISPAAMGRDADGRWQPLADLLPIPPEWRRPGNEIRSGQRCGGSRTIWRAMPRPGQARSAEPAARSPFRSVPVSEFYSGWEFEGPSLPEQRASLAEHRAILRSLEL